MRADVELNPAEQGVERALLRHYATGDPAPAFVERLERQLNAQAVAATGSQTRHEPALRFWQRWRATPRSLRWATGMAALLVVLALVVGALGPQRVWAQVQRLLGYVPGIGFVNLADARVLVAPVETTRDGITLRVEQVIAEHDKTRVVVRSEGLPREDALLPAGAVVPATARDAFALRLPGGRALIATEYSLRWGAGTFTFPELPPNVFEATLELARLPLLPAGAAPEDWRLNLVLQPATGPLVAALYPQPCQPVGASDTHHGITVSVVDVAHSPDETVLKLRGEWQNQDWEIRAGRRATLAGLARRRRSRLWLGALVGQRLDGRPGGDQCAATTGRRDAGATQPYRRARDRPGSPLRVRAWAHLRTGRHRGRGAGGRQLPGHDSARRTDRRRLAARRPPRRRGVRRPHYQRTPVRGDLPDARRRSEEDCPGF
jgi:hypothetical protein